MLLRLSPRRVALLAFLACTALFILHQQIPGGYRYDQLPTFKSPFNLHNSARPKALLHLASTEPIPPRITNKPLPRVQDPKAYIQQILNWNRPQPDPSHWPPYELYNDRDYDPNRWEQFEEDQDYYKDNGVELVKGDNGEGAQPYLPYVDYNSDEWQKKWKGEYVACDGPRGLPLNESTDDVVKAYSKIPENFPLSFTGSNEALGLDFNKCFERYDRYGPYGFGEDHEDVPGWDRPKIDVDWSETNWGALQNECLERNRARFPSDARKISKLQEETSLSELEARAPNPPYVVPSNTTSKGPEYKPRTAVLIRTWTGYKYTPNDMHAIRSMIAELNLLSGGEYQVFLYVHVKNKKLDIYNNKALHDQILRENVPKELRSIAILWSENVGKEWYPRVGDWQVYWQQFMCLQLFSKQHPEFEYIWNWETDARYTGQHYHFLEQMAKFAKKTPRKYLWERNKRFYIPAVHGTYDDFLNSTNTIIETQSAAKTIPPPVWGPRPQHPDQRPIGPHPPHSIAEDDYEWGVGEEADLITLLPIFDPRHTIWPMRNHIWNFVPGIRPIFTPQDPAHNGFDHPKFQEIERKVVINTVLRLSKRLIEAMHLENMAGRSMQAEMWTISTALHHGLKAVYAPQPVWSDRKWIHPYSDLIFNAGKDGIWSEELDSVYNPDREYNFQSWSWYYRSNFPRRLYRRWLGMTTLIHPWAEPERQVDAEEEEAKQGNGRMCLPGMLLHPVKQMWEDQLR
ncbi:hypothetical protein EJ05DRAFT_162245 [Pseudovirgaria hyperparasitica]|uniref:DUF3405 domain-containing protein n=1 Tax=Pseudovirgaria hyperparasitica TaxID=470096 RepID=A0A6A6VTU6_9PEZI|nr:uncharacterized protein EJ05DRAFT_162245 [Pseudovirgaria hyperparasitica]KAF2754002.1 hypothetical protein EJ05DRAFT_162245 [Pseudovirgaria hyperparasitica]